MVHITEAMEHITEAMEHITEAFMQGKYLLADIFDNSNTGKGAYHQRNGTYH